YYVLLRLTPGHRQLSFSTLAPAVVAHSMGGLTLRRWWAEPRRRCPHPPCDHAGRAAPRHRLARFAFSRNARQLRPAALAAGLAEREPPGRAARFTCFYANCDNIIFPPSSATPGECRQPASVRRRARRHGRQRRAAGRNCCAASARG
ncbi:MAG: hypothetical protein MZW92_47060, partial [Comamonadaceae bacterium]|nr:hypothetical protein [Comamonadaceae bacterium]